MKQIILKVKKSDWIAYSENYITNGNWMFLADYLDKRKSDNAFVNMVENTKGFIYNTGAYNTACELPKCTRLMSKTIEGFILNKTNVLIERNNGMLMRVYRIFDDSDNEINIYIDNDFVKLFDGFTLVVEKFSGIEPIKVLDDDKIIGLIMPIQRKDFNNMTV